MYSTHKNGELSKMSGRSHFFLVPQEIIYSFLVYLGILQISPMYHRLYQRVWFTIIFSLFTSQRESHSVPAMNFFIYTFTYFVPSGFIKNRVTQVNSKNFNGMFSHFSCLGWSILLLYAPAHKDSLFEIFTFELDASSYSFKITCILLWQVISP